MTCGIFGEISTDGKSVIILATGDDHELDQAAAGLRRMTPLLEKTTPPGALSAPLTWASVTQLAHTFDGGLPGQWRPGPRLQEWILSEFTRRTAAMSRPASPREIAATVDRPASSWEPAAEDPQPANGLVPAAKMDQPAARHEPAASFSQPASLLVPRPYQEEGAAQIAAGGKFLLFDSPGTGKTISTILGLIERQKAGHEIFPLAILAPSWDVCDVWARHIADWAPHWPVPNMYGGPNRRLGWGGIAITTYATAARDAADVKGPLARLKAEAVVVDEAHLCKNPGTKRSQALKRIAAHAGTFVGLSGTPVTRDTGDIYPVLEAMEPASWPSRERFVKRYCATEDDGYGQSVMGLEPLREPEFRAVLLGQYRRVAKEDVLDQLPAKVYSVRRVELPAEWRRAYNGMAADMLSDLPDGEELEVMSVLAQLTRLSQLASSACDVEVTLVPDEWGELKKHYEVTLKAPSWKVDSLLEVLAERRGQQAVAFTVSRQLADIAGAACERAGYRCGYITGTRKGADRKRDISAFQAGELDVMVATMAAGSLGITLTAAGTAVFLQRSWQLDQSLQAEDRLHRIGQEHASVEIIDIVALDTVDDRVRQLLRVKSGHLAQLVQDPRIVKDLLGGLK